jgi:DNA polymerase
MYELPSFPDAETSTPDFLRQDQQVAADAGAGTTHVLHRDFETRSQLDLKKVGAHKYAVHPTTECLCAAYAVDGGPVQLWLPGDPPPEVWLEAAHNPNWIAAAHNDQFETAIEQHILAPRFGFPLIPIERHRCTQAMALALGLPAKLSTAANALELANRKDAAGERLMHQMSKPRRARKGEDRDAVHWFDDAERLQRLYTYGTQDVEVERELHDWLLSLPPAEQLLWQLSSTINGRGFCFDRSFAGAARQIARAAAPEIDSELTRITGGAVTGINQIARLQVWLQEQGCSIESLDKKVLGKLLLDPELPPHVQQVLELRLGGAQAAVKKIDALLTRADDDDRVRDAFRYHGAATGRWSGEGFQPQNLKRPTVKDISAAIAAVSTGDYAHVRSLYPKPLAVVGDCTRSMIVATPGHMLIGGDLNSIESRILADVAAKIGSSTAIVASTPLAIHAMSPIALRPARSFGLHPGPTRRTARSGASARPAIWRSATWAGSTPGANSSRTGSPTPRSNNSKPAGVRSTRRSSSSGTRLTVQLGWQCANAVALSAAVRSHSKATVPFCS